MLKSISNMSNVAIGVVGMPGSGKSILASYLESKGWFPIHFGAVTIDELKRNNLPINEKNERRVREQLRESSGMGIYAELSWPKIEQKLRTEHVVIDGLYSWSEYRVLRDRLDDRLIVVSVVASRETRYSRLADRPVRPLTRREAEERDIAEIENLEKGGPIAMADFTLLNDGTIKELHLAIGTLLKRIRACYHVSYRR
jgi:dephospho-CoA kinase